eukprot:4739804-Pyramimonas_sp.AAC.2
MLFRNRLSAISMCEPVMWLMCIAPPNAARMSSKELPLRIKSTDTTVSAFENRLSKCRKPLYCASGTCEGTPVPPLQVIKRRATRTWSRTQVVSRSLRGLKCTRGS